MAIKCTCIYKFRDKNGNIKGYKLRDCNGKEIDIESNELKQRISSKQFEVDNLTLTSDNRLLTKTACAEDEDKIKESREGSKIGKRYQSIFEPLGIEVVTAVYLAYPREGDDINSMYKRTFSFRSEEQANIKSLVVDPTPILGNFSKEQYKNYEDKRYDGYKNVDNKYSENILMGGDTESKMVLLVLRKNGGYRTVILSEIEDLSSLGLMMQNRKEDEYKKYNLSVITLDTNKQPVVTSVGKNINPMERKKLAEKILASNVDLWLGQDATRNILDKIDKKQAAIKLKRVGIGTLGIPFAAVALVGVAGYAMVASLVEEVGGMSIDERMVFGNHGLVGVEVYRKAKEAFGDD